MIRMALWAVTLFLMLAALLPIVQPATSAVAIPVKTRTTPMVACYGLKVYDGDTFGCDLNGNRKVDGMGERVRLLGIDAPEMFYSKKNKSGKNRPYALDAKQYVHDAIYHQTIYLDFDETRRDRYGRLLAYVYRDPKRRRMLNAALLKKGHAEILFLGGNRREELSFHQVAETAQAKSLGIWSLPRD